jgi:hypothetical protein
MMKEHQFSYIFCYVIVSAQPKLSSELCLQFKNTYVPFHCGTYRELCKSLEVCNVLPHSFPRPKIYWQFVISLVAMEIVSAE